jgi:hypothetical protein
MDTAREVSTSGRSPFLHCAVVPRRLLRQEDKEKTVLRAIQSHQPGKSPARWNFHYSRLLSQISYIGEYASLGFEQGHGVMVPATIPDGGSQDGLSPNPVKGGEVEPLGVLAYGLLSLPF